MSAALAERIIEVQICNGRRALHNCLGAIETDRTLTDRRDIEIRLANQQRTELGLANARKISAKKISAKRQRVTSIIQRNREGAPERRAPSIFGPRKGTGVIRFPGTLASYAAGISTVSTT